MRICIPTMDDRGKEGVPSDHLGSAPYFTFVDTETGQYEAVPNGDSNHVHGACQPLKFLGTRHIDAMVCRGLGRGAFSRLADAGVQLFLTSEKNAEETVAAFEEGRLRPLTQDAACHGHGHGGHGHGGHGHSHGSGGAGRGGRT
ncbi:MAG: NifB/NifX family molybdenum-iron cluster-binding protein [Longimicrobiales bacterium]|nr:NifB/NifX family molybdenum-iron cluster-binding protein [Longimicrobiales bacterium]